MRRKVSAVLRKLGIPFLQTRDWTALHRLRRELAVVPRYTKGIVEIDGWKFEYLDAASFVSAFETVVFKRHNDFVPENDSPVILDCGANIGVAAIHYKKLFPKAKITAFEPDPEICDVLRRNLNANGAVDVIVVESAVWNERGTLEFFSEGADAGRLDNKQNDINTLIDESPKGKKTVVSTVRLADYLVNSSIDFIKLDIEGAESDVMEDCVESLNNVKSMVIEFHLTTSRPNELAKVMKALSSANFNVSVNSYGRWIDLLNKDTVKRELVEYDQYLLLGAWRD